MGRGFGQQLHELGPMWSHSSMHAIMHTHFNHEVAHMSHAVLAALQ